MDILLLKTFLEVAKRKHFGQAAERLFVTQSAVSARIKQLEITLGVELFVRKRNDIHLSEAGKRLLRHAEGIVRGWEKARQELALDRGYPQSLAIGCTLDLWNIKMHPLTAVLLDTKPELAMTFELSSSEVLTQKVVSGTLDLALVVEPPQSQELILREFGEFELILVGNPDNPADDWKSGRNYIRVDWGGSFEADMAHHLENLETSPIMVSSAHQAIDLIRERGGFAYVPRSYLNLEPQPPTLYRVENAPVIPRTLYAISRTDNDKTHLKCVLSLIAKTLDPAHHSS